MDQHLDPELAFRFVENDLSEDEAADVRTHLEACGECRTEVQMARDFAETSAAPLEAGVADRLRSALPPAAAPRRGRTAPAPRRAAWLIRGLAAAAVVVVAVGLWQLSTEDSPPGQGTLRSGDETRWQLQVQVGAEAWELRWQPQDGARLYRVLVQSETGRTVWEGEATRSELRVAGVELTPQLEDGETYFVTVTYRDGGTTQASPPVRLPALE